MPKKSKQTELLENLHNQAGRLVELVKEVVDGAFLSASEKMALAAIEYRAEKVRKTETVRDAKKELSDLEVATNDFLEKRGRKTPLDCAGNVYRQALSLEWNVDDSDNEEVVSSLLFRIGEKETVFEGFSAPRYCKIETGVSSLKKLASLVDVGGEIAVAVGGAVKQSFTSYYKDRLSEYRVVLFQNGENWESAVLPENVVKALSVPKFVLGSPLVYQQREGDFTGTGKERQVKIASTYRVRTILQAFLYKSYEADLTE